MRATRMIAMAVLIAGSGLALQRGAVAAAGSHAHRSAAARSQRPGARGRPGARRSRPGVAFPPHSHPGEEIIYVLEGLLEYRLEGKPPVTLEAGEVLFIPAGTIHAARNVGSGNAAELATYIVEKGKPLVALAK